MILIDSREPRHILNLLKSKNINFQREFLEVGDYVLPNGFVIERKEIRDFISSVFDGRLWTQARNLSYAERPILAIVGRNKWKEFYFTKNRHVHLAYNGAIISLVKDFGLSIISFDDDTDFVNFLDSINKYAEKKSKGSRPVKLAKRPTTLEDRKENLLSAIEGVSVSKAKILLESFGSIKNITNATIDDLKKVKGIGKKLAENIYKTLRD